MPQMIDLGEIEAQLSDMIARTGSEAERPGYEGVVARCQLATLPAITRWRAAEFNRGIDANTILNAVVGMCASAIAGEATSLTTNKDVQISIINKVLKGIGEEIKALMEARDAQHHVRKIEAGRA